MTSKKLNTNEMVLLAQEEVGDGSALSLPMVVELENQATLVFFSYPSGGPLANTVIRPPYLLITIAPTSPPKTVCRKVEPKDLGFTMGGNDVLGSPKDYKWNDNPHLGTKQTMDELYLATDSILDFYPLDFAHQSVRQKKAVEKYKHIFYGIAKAPLIPFYRAISPRFFSWLNPGR